MLSLEHGYIMARARIFGRDFWYCMSMKFWKTDVNENTKRLERIYLSIRELTMIINLIEITIILELTGTRV